MRFTIKYQHAFILSVLTLILFFVSCGKDDDNESNSDLQVNTFTYNTTTYSLSNGYIEYWGVTQGGSQLYEISLGSEDIPYDLSEEVFSGMGELAGFLLVSDDDNVLNNGDYTYSLSEDPFSMDEGSVGIDLVANPMDGLVSGNIYDATGGKVTVSSAQDIYTINFELTLDNGLTAKGIYEGELEEIF